MPAEYEIDPSHRGLAERIETGFAAAERSRQKIHESINALDRQNAATNSTLESHLRHCEDRWRRHDENDRHTDGNQSNWLRTLFTTLLAIGTGVVGWVVAHVGGNR